jgi:sterol desaturase/sphingolipid hydroxylase (fatty acid hydroxylase superfamily)
MWKWRTRIVYFGEMTVACALATMLFATSSPPAGDWILLFAGGFVAWTLAEYAIHRWVLHYLLPTQHSLHHASPNEPIIHIFWQIWVCFGFAYFLVGPAFLEGSLVAYAWYLFAHYGAHHSRDTLPASLVKHHNIHHKFSNRNFGVSTMLWDRLFGTILS